MKSKFITFKQNVSLNLYSNEYGLGYIKVKKLSIKHGFNPLLNIIILKSKTIAVIKNFCLNTRNSFLRKKIAYKIIHLINIKIYKGTRHAAYLPARGQRSHTNSKTKKKFKIIKF